MNIIKIIACLIFIIYFTDNSFAQDKLSAEKEAILEIDKTTNCKLRYYYYPNLQAYFDKQEKLFYYQLNGKWMTAEELPKNYGGYSLYRMKFVTLSDFDEEEPYKFINIHKKLFPHNYKGTKM